LGTIFDVTEKVNVVVPPPGAATTLEGRICTVMPVGTATARVMAALNVEFGVVIMVKLLLAPAVMLIEDAGDVSVNVGARATVTESETVCFTEPLVAATYAE